VSNDELDEIKRRMIEKIMKEDVVSEDELIQALQFIKEMRLYALNMNMEPWSIRQALILALEMDTTAAIERGVPKKKLEQFDSEVRRDFKSWVIGNKLHTGSQGL